MLKLEPTLSQSYFLKTYSDHLHIFNVAFSREYFPIKHWIIPVNCHQIPLCASKMI